jgi:hypothetical protein
VSTHQQETVQLQGQIRTLHETVHSLIYLRYCVALLLGTDLVRAQATEEARLTSETIAARDAENKALRAIIESVTLQNDVSSFGSLYPYEVWL